ncbi:protein kinase domain-containing protein [Cryptosporidium ryanae]|uniref:protein kinase domain-containing protein n=1 Tax=Cryptosporidium ryanae TaxID=515981 RepID=UPI00351A1BA5|nr:protein kinase domain-containing protein [Cryptosporidium ryanae]
MTVATSSRRNSRRSSVTSESGLSNHGASSKPKNSYIQKNSVMGLGGFSGGQKSRNCGFVCNGDTRTYLTQNGGMEDIGRKSNSVEWILNPSIYNYKELKGLIDCENEHRGEVSLRKYSTGTSKNSNGKSIRQVISSIVRGGSSKMKSRSASIEASKATELNKDIESEGTRIAAGLLDLGNEYDNTEAGLSSPNSNSVSCSLRNVSVYQVRNDRKPLFVTQSSSKSIIDSFGENDNSGTEYAPNNSKTEAVPILTGTPIQKSILTQNDVLDLRNRLDKVLLTEDNFIRSSLHSFQQFDKDKDGNMTIDELLDLLTTLGEHLALPPINRKIVANEISIRLNSNITVDSNVTENKMLISFPFFLKYFLSVLTTIRQKHFGINRSENILKNKAFRKHLIHEDDINDLYTFHYQLGAGTHGEVYLVTENYTRQRRVCKIVDKTRCNRKLDEIDQKVEILKQLDHPGVIHTYEVYEDKLNLYIIQEYCSGGNLFHSLHDAIQGGFRFSEYHVSRIIQQVLLGIRYLHLKRVLHKNLKPQNVLLTNSFGSGNTSIKLSDFGLCEIFNNSLTFSINPSSKENSDLSLESIGTLEYRAPEIINNQSFSYSVDVWAAGVIMYTIITGFHPFKGKNTEETRLNICKGEPCIEKITGVSSGCKSLLKRMLEKNPRDRITVEEALSHDWFSISYSNFSEVEIGAALLSHLRIYTKQSELRHLLIHMLSHQLALDTSQINMVTSIFRSLDTNNDGVLSIQELGTGLQKLGVSSRESSLISKAMDVDGNGMISYSEFISACYIWRQNEIRHLKSFFMKIDKDSDGKIDRNEFKQLLKAQKSKLLSNITRSFSCIGEVNHRTILPSSNQGVYTEWDAVLDEIDSNKDGQIDWNEFCKFIVEYFQTSRETVKAASSFPKTCGTFSTLLPSAN